LTPEQLCRQIDDECVDTRLNDEPIECTLNQKGEGCRINVATLESCFSDTFNALEEKLPQLTFGEKPSLALVRDVARIFSSGLADSASCRAFAAECAQAVTEQLSDGFFESSN
jgi:hypothetical protein